MPALTSWKLRLWFSLLAAVGVVGAHSLTYFMAENDGHHRTILLGETGHGSWSLLQTAALVAIPLLLLFFLKAFLGSAADRSPRVSYRRAALKLGALQGAGFVVVETCERLSLQADPSTILSDRLIWLGLAIQLVVAALASLVLLFAATVVRLIKSRRQSERARSEGVQLRPSLAAIETGPDLSRGAWSLRGPPLLPG